MKMFNQQQQKEDTMIFRFQSSFYCCSPLRHKSVQPQCMWWIVEEKIGHLLRSSRRLLHSITSCTSTTTSPSSSSSVVGAVSTSACANEGELIEPHPSISVVKWGPPEGNWPLLLNSNWGRSQRWERKGWSFTDHDDVDDGFEGSNQIDGK